MQFVPTLSLSGTYNHFSGHTLKIRAPYILAAFIAASLFQFTAVSAINCYIESDRIMYAAVIGIASPICAFAIASLLKERKEKKIKEK